MPLLSGKSNDIIHENYKTLKAEGKSDGQAWAIAYRTAGQTKKKANSVAKKVIKKPKPGVPVKQYN